MKENQRIAVTKRMLKEGLLRLLRTKELKKIRVCELCEESGINRATFYRHYETTQDVLFELERDIALQMFPSSGTPLELSQVKARLEKVCVFVKENSEVLQILFRCNAEEDMMRRVSEFYKSYVDLKIRERQELRVDPETAKSIVSFLAGGFYCLMRQWVEAGMPQTPQELAEIAVRLIRWPSPGEPFPA